MIRVLNIVSSLNKGSGVMNVIMNYYRHFDREKIQFDFLYFFEAFDNYREEIESFGGKVYKFSKPGIKTYLTSKKQLHNLFNEIGKEYRFVHCHEINCLRLIYPCVKNYSEAKLILHIHSSKYSENLLKSIRNKVFSMNVVKKVDYMFACSNVAAEKIYGKGVINKSNYKLIYNAIDYKRFLFNEEERKKYRLEFGVESDEILLGHVGRLSYVKNHSFLFKVFKEYNKSFPNSKLMLVGDGELREELQRQVTGFGLEEKVIFTLTRRDVSNIYNAMDIFLFPSFFEGLGMVLVEASFNGLPCIASSTIPNDLRIFKNIKFLNIDNNIQAWVDELCEMSKDRERRTTHYLSEYSIEDQVANLMSFYLQ